MADDETEAAFTFVDKRKLSADTAPEPEQSEADKLSVDDPLQSELDPDEADGDEGGVHGSQGLVAYVVGLIASDAWQKLGLIVDPATGKAAKDLRQARFSIDCVAALVGVIEQQGEDLPPELRRDLQRVLGDLRLNFVEQSRRP